MRSRNTSITKGIIIGLAVGVVIGLAVMLGMHLMKKSSSCEDAARSGADLIETLTNSAEASVLARDMRENGGTQADRLALRARITSIMDDVNARIETYNEAVKSCPVVDKGIA